MAALLTSTASALTISVPASAPDSGAACVASPCPNLRSAVILANANPGSTIVLASGIYALDLGQLTVTASTTIAGSGPAATKVIQMGEGRVFEVTSAGSPTVTLQALEVTGGKVVAPVGAEGLGGGIASLSSGGLTLREVRVDNNSARGGAGTPGSGAAEGGFGGEAEGGGVYSAKEAPLTLDHATISENTTTGGAGGEAQNGKGGFGGYSFGAGVADNGPATVIDSTIGDNVARAGVGGSANLEPGPGGRSEGAGLDHCCNGGANIERTLVAGNTAVGGDGGTALAFGGRGGLGAGSFGGGLSIRAGVVENSTLTANTADAGKPGTGELGEGELEAPAGGALWTRSKGTPVLVSDTLFANVSDPADGGAGGNIAAFAGAVPAISDTIVAGGSAAVENNCAANITDGGHNLEDSTPSQCGLGGAPGDLIGADPLLGPLAPNGGATQTLALGPGSPALGAGGSCRDPLAAEAPLATDQRALPRVVPCDIGAFQHQPPTSSSPPVVLGAPAVGGVLTCSPGEWSGDSPLTFSYSWLRNGGVLAGAAAPTYAILAGDAGAHLACEVTARNIYATASAVSAAVSVAVAVAAPAQPPTLSAVGESHRVWREGARLATLARTGSRRAPVGTSIRFTLNTASSIKFVITSSARGRIVGGHCVASRPANRRARRCSRRITVGGVSFALAQAGTHAIGFQGRLTRARHLRPGSYQLLLSAANAAGTARAAPLAFRIVS
jgi:hypothetical protein